MPNDITAEHAELRRKGRQRLVGAVLLALLAVVFVPMVLDPEPRQQRAEPVLTIPPKDGSPPLAVAPAPKEVTSAPESAKPATDAPPVVASATPPDKPAPPPEPAKSAAAPKLEGFGVQIGAFREDAKLAQARSRLEAIRVPHYTERLSTASGELTRLRAGPYRTREAAEKAAAEMKKAGIEGRVVSLP
jgi:DedD protein